jgi:type II secretory pathway component PulM
MKQWFASLQPRERSILIAGSIAAAIIIFWSFVWKPITDGTAEMQSAIAAKQQVLVDLLRVGSATADEGPGSSGSQSLFVLIDQTAQASGLGGAITRARPEGANEIDVSFQNASFDVLLTWLVQLQQNNGVTVEGASINTTRQRGLVSGQLALRRS